MVPGNIVTMISRARQDDRVLRLVQRVFGLACTAVAVPLIFEVGPAASVTNGTSVRILASGLLALAFGAFSAARDPRHNRLVLRIEIVFCALTTGFLAYKLLTDSLQHNHALIVLPPAILCLALLVALYPPPAPEGDDQRTELRRPAG